MAGDRAGLWVRVSSGAQDEANQVPDVERHADGKGYRVITRYTLHDKSAYKGEQQEAQDQVIEDMKAGIIKVLVIWHSDRLDRREVLDALLFLRRVREAGGRVESAQEGEVSERSLPTLVTAWMNNQKSEHLSEQIKLSHRRIEDNRAFRGRDPFAYEITGSKYDKRLVIIEKLRPVVEEIFSRVIDGESLADICTWLDSLKVKRSRTTTKKYKAGQVTPWWPAMLMRLIRHPAYSGRYYVKRTDDATGKVVTYIHSCEAIVSRKTQREAIAALANREKRGPRGSDETRAMLKGIITCPHCENSPMYRMTGRLAGGRAEYYRCYGRGPQRKGCGNMVIMDDVDRAVNKIIAEWFAIPVVRRVRIKGHDWSEEIDTVKDAIRDLGSQGLDDDEYDREHARLTAERNRLKALPAEPDQIQEEETGELWSDAYEAVERPRRGAWLKAHGFAVQATREAVTVMQGQLSGTVAP